MPYAFLAIALALCYFPVVTFKFLLIDDGWYLDRLVNGDVFVSLHHVWSGRPVLDLLLTPIFQLARTVDGLSWVRGTTVASILLLSWVLYQYMREAGWSELESALASLAICTVPAFQVFAAWAVCVAFPYAIILIGASCFLARDALQEPEGFDRYWTLGVAATTVFIAFLIYQPAGMFFLVFLAIDCFAPRSVLTLRGLAFRLGAFLVGAGAAFLVAQVSGAPGRARVVFDLGDKLAFVVREPLVSVLNVWNTHPTPQIAAAVGTLAIAGLLVWVRGSVGRRLRYLGLAVALLALAYAPGLVVAENPPTYRTQLAPEALVVFYLFLTFSAFGRLLPWTAARAGSVGFLALLAGLLASHSFLWHLVLPLGIEFTRFRADLEARDLSSYRLVYFIRTDADNPLWGGRKNEFGEPSFGTGWVSVSALKLVLDRPSWDGLAAHVEYGPADKAPRGDRRVLVVDTRRYSAPY